MNGLSNRLSASDEKKQTKNAVDTYAKKAASLGKFPGTHSLGVEFKTKK